MEQKNSQTYNINIKNVKEVYDYCLLNKILDIDDFINKCFKKGFHIEKYGLLGKTLNDGEKDLKTGIVEEKQVIKEVIVEKRVEVPVEVIKEVEKIVEVFREVPIEIIKEVPVEKVITKIEYISDKSSENELTEKIFHLNEELEKERQKFSTKTEEMENFFQNEMSKKDEELNEVRRNLDKLPVEVIKEVEVIVEKPNDKSLMLQETLTKLRKELIDKDSKITELEGTIKNLEQLNKNQGAVYMKGSNLTQNL
jgi:hypothetical protein